MGRLSPMEIAVIVILGLLLFGGGSRLSNIGKELASGIRNFKRGLNDDEEKNDPNSPLPKELSEGGSVDKAGVKTTTTKA